MQSQASVNIGDPATSSSPKALIDGDGDLLLVVGQKQNQGRILVSTSIMTKNSVVFRTMIQGPWKEAVELATAAKSREPYNLALPEDDFHSLRLMCEILYDKATSPDVLQSWDLFNEIQLASQQMQQMTSLIAICDKYTTLESCRDFLQTWISNHALWFERFTSANLDHKYGLWNEQDFQEMLAQLMFSACLNSFMLDNVGLFRRISRSLLLSDYSLKTPFKEIRSKVSGPASVYGLEPEHLMGKI
jgi:hypothetical protein